MNDITTTRAIAKMYYIAEIRVFQAIQSFGVKRHVINQKIGVSVQDFEDFKLQNPEIIDKWQNDYSCTHRSLSNVY